MDRKKEEALVPAEGGSEVMRSTASADERVEDADEVDYDDDDDDVESDRDSGDHVSSDEEEEESRQSREDLVGLKMGEKQFVKAPIAVYWDIGSCGIPEEGCDDHYACGLVDNKISISICRSAIAYLHVIGNGDKYADFSFITAAMLSRAQEFPSPTNYLLISGNSNLSITLNLLKKKGHNILVALPNGEEALGLLIKDASSVWFLDTLKLGGIPLIPTSSAQPDEDVDALLTPSLSWKKCF
ncbi:unnamed protein product [Eruca vesicaria subsp. sativa]|uniref:NYN domain-containing protein n=1 Tax=Eruca vesicaria subsp. sativa TaxID=29727 RepID=A0ABC8KEJ3_ERUVS|nr:unnamed protein product [Eruca vesicaria subsp. sativa]